MSDSRPNEITIGSVLIAMSILFFYISFNRTMGTQYSNFPATGNDIINLGFIIFWSIAGLTSFLSGVILLKPSINNT